MNQLQAAFASDAILELLSKNEYQEKVTGLLKLLSVFNYESSCSQTNNIDKNSILCVVHNLITRGLPTRTTTFIEEKLSDLIGLTKYTKDEIGNFKYRLIDISLQNQIVQALHIIEPRLNTYEVVENSWEDLGGEYEEMFLMDYVPELVGQYFVQLLECQREFNSLLVHTTSEKEYKRNMATEFTLQKVDFSHEYPYYLSRRRIKGFIIEVDGSQHNFVPQADLDRRREQALIATNNQFKTYRIKTANWRADLEEKLGIVHNINNSEYGEYLKSNFENPLYKNELGLKTLELALTPIGIARIQKCLVEYLLQINYDFSKPITIKIAIIERDVACAWLAIEDIKCLFETILPLSKKKYQIPIFELVIFNSPEFSPSKINAQSPYPVRNIESLPEYQEEEFDLLIDISVLQRYKLTHLDRHLSFEHYFLIRSVHHVDIREERSFYTDKAIHYQEFAKKDTKTSKFKFDIKIKEKLTYLMQSIFRKEEFRDGQLEILSRALQYKTVIGLLPTGSGKSLTYQLAALLQPGICLVVDPIRSLMTDQVDGLQKNFIDACLFINSILTPEEKAKNTIRMAQAKVLFCFLSPERFLISEFRKILSETSSTYKNYFSYVVIDEVHCVSEWGHDFRTSYLSIGKNALNYCKTKTNEPIPLFGLTATASFDVLADVKRELNVDNNIGSDTLVRLESDVKRDELFYRVLEINVDAIGLAPHQFQWELPQRIATSKVRIITDLLNSKISDDLSNLEPTGIASPVSQADLDNFLDDNCTNAGIIFCPHRQGKFGVTNRFRINGDGVDGAVSIAEAINLSIPNIKKGEFLGVGGADERVAQNVTNHSFECQTAFKNNKLHLLIATKAFGMGVDKPNIRYTIHLNYPNSLEGYVQEAGRAGRDRKVALSYILYARATNFFDNDGGINQFFHDKSFQGVERDMTVIKQLLHGYDSPNRCKLDVIAQIVNDELEEELSFHFGADPHNINWFFVWKNAEYLGYIRVRGDSIETKPGLHKEELFRQIREIILEIAHSEDVDDYLYWLRNETIGGFQKGILETVSENINELWLDFKDNHQVRQRMDTERAIYRLTLLGVIDDYEVDYRASKFLIKLSPKDATLEFLPDATDSNTYINHLYRYFRRYYTEQKSIEMIEKITSDAPDDTQKNLEYLLESLVHFVYDEIADKRKRATIEMRQVCERGIAAGDNYEILKKYIDLYFNSKYAREDYTVEENLFSLSIDVEGNKEDVEIVWKYLDVINKDKSAPEITNIQHLNGAASRLLNTNPNNGILLILKGFAMLVLDYKHKTLLLDAQNEVMEGFYRLYQYHSPDFKEFEHWINKFCENLEGKLGKKTVSLGKKKLPKEISTFIESLPEKVLLKAQIKWLEEFTEKHHLETL